MIRKHKITGAIIYQRAATVYCKCGQAFISGHSVKSRNRAFKKHKKLAKFLKKNKHKVDNYGK